MARELRPLREQQYNDKTQERDSIELRLDQVDTPDTMSLPPHLHRIDKWLRDLSNRLSAISAELLSLPDAAANRSASAAPATDRGTGTQMAWPGGRDRLHLSRRSAARPGRILSVTPRRKQRHRSESEGGGPAGSGKAPQRNVHVSGRLMSRRFPAFSRLFWQHLRRPPRLNPAMRARMWQPGQSGNPSGRKAHAETMPETLEQPVELSAGAKRTRRWRERKQQDLMVVSVNVAQEIIAKLIRLGWLDEAKCRNREAIAAALAGLARKAIESEMTSAPISM